MSFWYGELVLVGKEKLVFPQVAEALTCKAWERLAGVFLPVFQGESHTAMREKNGTDPREKAREEKKMVLTLGES